MEALKKNSASLPDAVYMYSDTSGFNPNVSTDPNIDDINSERYISNETISLPASRVVGNHAYPPLYAVSYGPIYLPDLTTHGDHLQVTSVPWTARTGDARINPNGSPLLNTRTTTLTALTTPATCCSRDKQTFLVDYGAGKIAVPQAAYDQTFVLQVTRQTSGLQPPVTITVPATITTTTPATGYDGNWFGTVDTTTNGSSLPSSSARDPWTAVTLYRPFAFKGYTDQSGNNSGFDSDPYEYEVFSSDIPGTTANIGVLAFNQLASGQNGAQALKARISYLALDWHILHEDHDVAPGSSTIRLTLNHLKKVGDVQFDQSVFGGLIPSAANPADIMLLDLDTGLLYQLNGQAGTSLMGAETAPTANDPAVIDADTATTTNTNTYQISYQNGRLTFPDRRVRAAPASLLCRRCRLGSRRAESA